ncbi:hypothetical protein niasHS_005439 [Heterodera schachtii]|uniref:DDE-1 domain-containing protein n=1 Tax=Heterodera schachtii TaxID=97005 RepID=A0ABD2JIT2_HETSC
MESFCCVCKAIYGGSHSCSVCKLPCHTFCGDSGGVENEGFGGKVVCHNCVTVATTGHDKMRVTVCLTARNNGQKLKPYVLVNRKRPVPQIVNQFAGKLVINFAGSVWMNDETTEDYLHKIIGAKLFVGERLLVWDAFGSHKSERTTKMVKGLGVETVFVPGGCTKFIQAPDVSWNKPFKERIRNFYNIWMSNEAEKEFTLAGNPKAPALHVVLDWIHLSWQEISKEVIIKSFEGAIGPIGIKLLREFRATETVKDGRNDHEEAGLSDDDGDVELDQVGDEDEILIC